MFRKIISFSAICILCIVSISAASRIVYVAVNSPNDPGSGTNENPFRRIQDAMDAAMDGDTVEIRPGIYTGIGNYDLDPNGTSITIGSSNEPNAMENTIIDPSGLGRGFLFISGEDPNCILSGLTIRNGHALYDSGGGIYCVNSSPLITHCMIENNTADLYGGGIYGYDASPKLVQCIIRSNQAENGGGLECNDGTPELTNCIVSNNTALYFGGGADFLFRSNPKLTNCTIVKNSASLGGGICYADSHVIIENSILWENQASAGAQLAMEFSIDPASALIRYCDFQGGRAAIWDPCDVTVWAEGNIEANPYFVCFEPAGNSETWDFHLQSAYGRWDTSGQMWVIDTSTSLCIDAGDPNSQWGDEAWPNGRRVNMGVYGGTGQASKNGNPADFNIDNRVDLRDLSELAEQWFLGQTCIEDLNIDGDVDIIDLSLFAEQWLWERP